MKPAAPHVVFVVDGLRPDLINETDTPTIARLRRDGVSCENAHALSPPVTRINGAAMVTGRHPGTNGMFGNEMYWPAVVEDRPFLTGDAANLHRLRTVSGSVLECASLGRRLAAGGQTLVTVGSGSSGNALLLNSEATESHGAMISVNRPQDGEPIALPRTVEDELVGRFGPPPAKVSDRDRLPTITYATTAIRDYVLPDLQPDVLVYWITEPDHAHHTFGLAAVESQRARRTADQAVATVLEALGDAGKLDDTNLLVISDHGFSTVSGVVDLEHELVNAGLKQSTHSTDVVVANSGCGLLYVRDRDLAHIRRLVDHLQQQPFAEAIFTAPEPPGQGGHVGKLAEDAHQGWVEGTLSNRLLGYAGNAREPDIVMSLPWSPGPENAQIPGDSVVLARGGTTRLAGQHGNLSPYDIRSTMIAWGPAFHDGLTLEVPTGNLDVTPTLLALTGLDTSSLDGRVLRECFTSSQVDAVDHDVATLRVEAPGSGYTASVEVATIGQHRYLSSAWRDR